MMILHNVVLPGKPGAWQIVIRQGIIESVAENKNIKNTDPSNQIIDGRGALALPGFINSHDHLDFNLFPQLGSKKYTSYRQWGPEIQTEYKDLIEKVQRVPHDQRVLWGLYKNLLNGFTTVVHHGTKIKHPDEPVFIFQDARSLHSVGFEKNWKWKLNLPFPGNKPLVMHIGEGTDREAIHEIDLVRTYNFFRKKVIAVHGVVMNPIQAKSFEGLVWCPASNYFLLDQTADIPSLKGKINIVFGTDSTLTASWNAWTQFRTAMESGLVTEEELLLMLTQNPARLWKLGKRGRLEEGCYADLILINKKEELFRQGPENLLLIIQNGKIKMMDSGFHKDRHPDLVPGFGEINLNGCIKKVPRDLPVLVHSIKTIFPEAPFPFSC